MGSGEVEGQRTVPRDRVCKVLCGGGPPGALGGVGWAGVQCPEPLPSSELALFLPRRNNFLLSGPRAQELRGDGLGRSFAISEPDDYTAVPGAPRFLSAPNPGVAIDKAPGSGHRLECQGGCSSFSCRLRRGA